MKKSIFDQSEPKDNMMLAALKQAVSNLKATNSMTGQTGSIAKTKQIGSSAKTEANPLRLDQVERKLIAADRTILRNENQNNTNGGSTGNTPRMSEIQKDEEYYRQGQQREQAWEKEHAREAFERKTMNILYGEPLAKKPVPLDKGVVDAGETWRNPTYTGGALAKNGAKTHGYTDTASDVGAPVRFWSGTDEDKKRQHTEAISRGVETEQEFYDYLVAAHIDIFNATPEQKEIIDMVGKELMKKSVLDTLTVEDKVRIFENTLEYLYSNTKAANGDPYPVFIDIARSYDNSKGVFQEQKAMKDSSMSDSELKMIFEYGRQPSKDEKTTETNSKKMEYKNQIYLEEMAHYKEDLQKGRAKVGDIQKYYDRALMRIYEDCVKPVYVKKDAKGNKLNENVPIGELIPPEDQSFGAQVARAAMRLVGLGYKEEAGQGYYDEMLIDCSGLVKWAVTEVDQYLGVFGISHSAAYQEVGSKEKVWTKDQGEIVYGKLKPGDTLFWEGDETVEIKHTAIYVGNGLMIEAQNGSVQIVGVRKETKGGDEEDSTLVQINRMTEAELLEKAERNKKLHG